MAHLERLRTHLLGLGRVLLGYSGGVDSALLAVVGRQTLGNDRFLAVIGRSASYPRAQHQAALELAQGFDVPLLEIQTDELADPRYVRNHTDRCYFCKTELWSRLIRLAQERRYDSVIDGTNASDLSEHRPGLRASREWGIRSPLAELGWTKSDVRSASRELALPTSDAPAAPCLSSRVMYGLEITPGRLQQVEDGEAYLRSLGVTGDLRVRHHGASARVEVSAEQMGKLRSIWDAVTTHFAGLGFVDVVLDPAGYRRGGLLEIASRTSS
jgi:uncharacterized protein